MDERIEAFLDDLLTLEGYDPKVIREVVHRRVAEIERQFRDAETDRRMKDKAVDACRSLCRARVVEEIHRHRGTPTAEHLDLARSVITARRVSH